MLCKGGLNPVASAHIKMLNLMEHIGEGETGRSWEFAFQASFPNQQSPDSSEKLCLKKKKVRAYSNEEHVKLISGLRMNTHGVGCPFVYEVLLLIDEKSCFGWRLSRVKPGGKA